MRQARQEAGGEQQAEVRGERGGYVADHEQPGQEQQQSFVRDACTDAGQHGGADDDTERVRRHEVARVRDGHADPVGDLGQQPKATTARAGRAKGMVRENLSKGCPGEREDAGPGEKGKPAIMHHAGSGSGRGRCQTLMPLYSRFLKV